MPTFVKHLLLLCLLPAVVISCQHRGVQPPVNQNQVLAVASFTQPTELEDLLAGYIPEDVQSVDPKVLHDLDDVFADVLRQESQRAFIGPDAASRCQKLTSHQQKEAKLSALAYWVEVGKCLKADYLLVPMLLQWQKRDGGPMGAKQPAAVTIDVFVVDIADGNLLSRGHFEETQRALTDNLLEADKFISRGAQWVTALELAREGLVEIVKELGL